MIKNKDWASIGLIHSPRRVYCGAGYAYQPGKVTDVMATMRRWRLFSYVILSSPYPLPVAIRRLLYADD